MVVINDACYEEHQENHNHLAHDMFDHPVYTCARVINFPTTSSFTILAFSRTRTPTNRCPLLIIPYKECKGHTLLKANKRQI
jgi:hypothetical protein